MPSTNKTDKLKLSQFEATDKPSFLQDYNADMQKIDENMYRIDEKARTIDLTYLSKSEASETYATKNEMSKLVTVFNYFKNTGPIVKTISNTNAEESITIKSSPYTGLGDNEKIKLVNATTIEVQERALYAIWGVFVISLAGGGATMDGIPVSVVLSIYHDGTYSLEHVNTTVLRTTDKTKPDTRSEQSIIVPQTIVELPEHSQFKITLKTPENYDGRQQAASKFYIMKSGIGIEKLP